MILSVAFLIGLMGTVMAAKAFTRSEGESGSDSPAVHRPGNAASLPTVEC